MGINSWNHQFKLGRNINVFSIIVTCKGRLDHLKRSLPRLLSLANAEVIVVDFSCPQGTAGYVRQNFPLAKVVTVPEKAYFSNWEARNAGAKIAKGETLVFCDADTILAVNALSLIALDCFGYFTLAQFARFETDDHVISRNQLRGFQVIPSQSFRLLGGYDEVLQGYAAGGDTDLEERCMLIGVPAKELDAKIVEEVISHDNVSRLTYHQSPLRLSYLTGLLYRRAKLTLMQLNREVQTPIDKRNELYFAARQAADFLEQGKAEISISIEIDSRIIGMPRQLGYESGKCSVSIVVQASLQDKIE